jgi:hypothetical protein
MLETVWRVAQIKGQDFGRDIQALVPLLRDKPERLEQLYAVATSTSLFGIDRDSKAATAGAFDVMRSELLVEVIRGASGSKLFCQGEVNSCTDNGTRPLLSPDEIIRLTCGLAIDGQCTTLGGDRLVVGNNDPAVYARVLSFAQEKSGLQLSGDGSLSRTAESVTVRLPSLGMAIVSATIMSLTGIDPCKDEGQSSEGYTQIVRSLTGIDTACAARDAIIPVNKSGRAVKDDRDAVKQLSQIDYLDETLRQIAASGGQKDLGYGSSPVHKGVPVDIQWMDINPNSAGERRHGRHAMLATALTHHDDGHEYYTLLNPLGDSIRAPRQPGDPVRFYPPGTELGDKSSIWWKTGENGVVYVRKDVFEKNLMTVMVQYDERYVAGQSRPVRLLGTLEQQKATFDAPVDWIVPAPRNIETAQSPNTLTKVDKLAQEEEKKKTLAELALEQQAYARTKAKDQENEPTLIALMDRYKKDDKKILTEYDDKQNLAERPKKPSENYYASFSSGVTSRPLVLAEVASATPPPPPQVSPQELEEQRARQRTTTPVTAA